MHSEAAIAGEHDDRTIRTRRLGTDAGAGESRRLPILLEARIECAVFDLAGEVAVVDVRAIGVLRDEALAGKCDCSAMPRNTANGRRRLDQCGPVSRGRITPALREWPPRCNRATSFRNRGDSSARHRRTPKMPQAESHDSACRRRAAPIPQWEASALLAYAPEDLFESFSDCCRIGE